VFDDPGRFNVGRSEGVGVEDGGGVGEDDCAVTVVIRENKKMNDNKFRMNSIRISNLLLPLYREGRILCWKTKCCPG
jgi:hypothetical protein